MIYSQLHLSVTKNRNNSKKLDFYTEIFNNIDYRVISQYNDTLNSEKTNLMTRYFISHDNIVKFTFLLEIITECH